MRIVPRGAKQRALLGALIVRAGQVVPSERLVDELWGAHPPANAANALQAHVARLRRLLPPPPAPAPAPGPLAGPASVPLPGRGSGSGCGCAPGSGCGCGPSSRPWLESCPPGYVLRLGPATTDAQRFDRLAARAGVLAASAPGCAADVLRQALALWRGPALHGSGQGPLCSGGAALLEERRLLALESLFDASLRADRGAEITGELQELVAVHPLRERFQEQLMAALELCGRRAEALGAYERARRRLARELGVGPGAVLRGRREAILHGTAPGPGTGTGPGSGSGPGTGPGMEEGGAGAVGAELECLRAHVELLRREQRELSGRIARLTARHGWGP
ncbi:AfsR/SARP family transcriptional regulator [Streptomyces ambofaciens]|uniref:AfsR/SARP family transcriptional regulator n=1 Tax=Streptomyces ambofaciens TaxID=1889 RepID=UPI001FD2EA2C|nr:AfsR/SARP family transcriptional regulator [Streptomyces ambofaciens]